MSVGRHLKRLTAVWSEQEVYFITICVAGRKSILANDVCAAILREEWTALRVRHGWSVGRYVIMPDHVHFMTAPVLAAAKPLSVAIGRWKQWTAKRIMRSRGQSGPLWQAEYFDHLLRSTESRSAKWAYVLENPVRAGLVQSAGLWPYGGFVDFE